MTVLVNLVVLLGILIVLPIGLRLIDAPGGSGVGMLRRRGREAVAL